MNVKKISAVVLAGLMALSLAACSGGSQSSGSSGGTSSGSTSSGGSSSADSGNKIELEYWFEGAGPERTPTHEAIINGFNEQSTTTKVNGLYVDLTSGQDKVNVAWAGGAMPDIIYAQDSWQSSMFIQGMCLQLDDWFNAWDEKDQFDAASLESVRSKDVQGRLFCIPVATNLTGIWYRKDIFEEKGVEAPTTWDNFFNAVEQLTYTDENGNQVYGHTLRGGAGSTNQLINEIVCYAGIEDYFDENGVAQILRSPEAVECTERFAAIYQNGQTPESAMTASFKEMVADFNAEVAVTLIHNLGSYENQRETFTPDQYAFVPFPASVKGTLGSQLASVKGLVISSTTEHPEECWEYVKWNASEDAVSAINEAVGELPCRIDSASHDWVKNAPHMSNLPEYTAAEKYVVNVPTYLPDYNTINTQWAEPEYQKVLAGTVSAEDFLNGWADQIEEAYQEYVTELAA